MKRLACIFFAIFLSVSSVSALESLLLEFETPANTDLGFSLFNLVAGHTHFSDNFGVKEEISFSPFNANADYIVSAYIGPAFKIPVSKGGGVEFITSIGGKLAYAPQNKNTSYGSDIKLTDSYDRLAYALAGDSQFKFMADKRASLIVGLKYGIGNIHESWKQSVKSTNPDDHYKTITRPSKEISSWFFLTSYIGCSINF